MLNFHIQVVLSPRGAGVLLISVWKTELLLRFGFVFVLSVIVLVFPIFYLICCFSINATMSPIV